MNRDEVLVKEMCWGGNDGSPVQGGRQACGPSAEMSAVIGNCEQGVHVKGCGITVTWTHQI